MQMYKSFFIRSRSGMIPRKCLEDSIRSEILLRNLKNLFFLNLSLTYKLNIRGKLPDLRHIWMIPSNLIIAYKTRIFPIKFFFFSFLCAFCVHSHFYTFLFRRCCLQMAHRFFLLYYVLLLLFPMTFTFFFFTLLLYISIYMRAVDDKSPT